MSIQYSNRISTEGYGYRIEGIFIWGVGNVYNYFITIISSFTCSGVVVAVLVWFFSQIEICNHLQYLKPFKSVQGNSYKWNYLTVFKRTNDDEWNN